MGASYLSSAYQKSSSFQPIAEDSVLILVLSCTPFIGIIPSIIQENSINNQWGTEKNQRRAIELLKVKNIYKLTKIASCFISAGLILAGIVVGVLGAHLIFGVLAACYILYSGYEFFGIYCNKRVITKMMSGQIKIENNIAIL